MKLKHKSLLNFLKLLVILPCIILNIKIAISTTARSANIKFLTPCDSNFPRIYATGSK